MRLLNTLLLILWTLNRNIIFFNTQYLTAKPSLTVPIIILGLVADGIVYMLAPVDNSNKKLDEVEKQVYGKKAKIILTWM